MISSLLIANRGEIACRIVDTCRRLGIRAIAIYAEADRNSLHLRLADEAVLVDSYLSSASILEAARRSQAQAIHPGFGFLAENAQFASAVREAGLIFIGPQPQAIQIMGNKAEARQRASQRGVPVLPGGSPQEAATVGYPLMVKASAGGGGKGMRLVERAEDLEEALASAGREALAAFGSAELLVERALLRPRHIEVQVLGDQHGRLITAGERECSVQRRHQKVVEEAPAPNLDRSLRQQLLKAALEVARSVDYCSAGTVEFLVEDERFYFLEMNTRLQVEHAVTEQVTGLDLVEWQIRVAEGQPLTLPDHVSPIGHALEARVYAEDSRTFLPAIGPVLVWTPPDGHYIRVESGIGSGDSVTPYYDPMLAKIIAHGETRQEAVRRLSRALEQTVLLGTVCNLELLRHIVDHPEFVAGHTDTHFLQRHPLGEPQPPPEAAFIAAALTRQPQPGWRNSVATPVSWPLEGQQVSLAPDGVSLGDRRYRAHLGAGGLEIEGHRQPVVTAEHGPDTWVHLRQGIYRLRHTPLLPPPAPEAAATGSLRAPMPGKVLALLVQAGEQVSAGTPLLKLEAMKMEHTILAPFDGLVSSLPYAAGEQVEAEAVLAVLKREGE